MEQEGHIQVESRSMSHVDAGPDTMEEKILNYSGGFIVRENIGRYTVPISSTHSQSRNIRLHPSLSLYFAFHSFHIEDQSKHN